MKTIILLFLFLVPVQSICAEHTRSKDIVINAFPVGFGAVANFTGDFGTFGHGLVPSASVYWTLNRNLFWQTGIEGHFISDESGRAESTGGIGLISIYHGVMLRANRNVTRNGFYLLGGMRMAYVPNADVRHLEDKGGLFIGPMLSVGFETGKIADHLGFIFNILSISPMYRVVQGDAASARSSSWLTAVSFYQIGINWAL